MAKINEKAAAILSVKNLSVNYYTRHGIVRALQDVTFEVHKEKILGVVGESGSGKTVLALSILNIIEEPGKIESGEVVYKGKDLLKMPRKDIDRIRGRDIAMIFPDPMSAFDPTLTVGAQVSETIRRHHSGIGNREARDMVIDLFKKVRIPSPKMRFDEFPFMFSGGMIQRVMIADALSSQPDFIIADNPTQALDVTIQAQILELMTALQKTFGTTFIFITNSLPILAKYADSILVIYGGMTVEYGSKDEILQNPSHPYTQGLIDSIPRIKGKRLKRLRNISGFSQDTLKSEVTRCIFSDRCEKSGNRCFKERPKLLQLSNSSSHFSRCFISDGSGVDG